MIKFTEEQKQFIYKNYKGIGNKELINKFNKKFNTNLDKQIYNFKRNHHLNSGLTGQFEKGHESFNKGKKWDEYMSKEKQEMCRKTTFKKGNIPSNSVPIGTERLSKDGCLEVKIKNGNLNKNWKYKHRLIYEKNFGKIPKGYNVVFADGNKLNLEPNNLILVSDAELLIMNEKGLFKKNIELTKTGSNLAKLINKTNKVIKNARK